MTAAKTKPTENELLVAEKFGDLLHCLEGQPGRAKQICDEIAALLPEPTEPALVPFGGTPAPE